VSRKKSKHRKAVPQVATAPELSADAPSEEIPEGEPELSAAAPGAESDEMSEGESVVVVESTAKKRRGKKAEPLDELSAAAPSEERPEPSEEPSADSIDELRADAPDELHADAPDELVAQMAADELRAQGDGAGDDSPPGDDIVGEQITDEAGVEAALLPGGLSAVQLRHLIEALVFAADKPVTLQRLRQLTRVSDVTRIEAALGELQEDYKERGIALQQVSGGYQFRTNTTFSSWVQQLIAGRPVRLSRAQLETLAIVAYRQPITRPEIDEIRGVDSSATLRLLLERSLIRVLGKREEVGRPTLYGTTKEFLDFFSLSDLRELPTLREYSELTAESRQVMSDRLGVPLDANGELIEPEVSDIDSDLETPQDNASIVDSILAEHAAAEAEAEARFDASGMADAALSGADSFSEAMTSDDDAMSLSGEVTAFGGAKVPASEARSYVDAIRASLVTDELDGLGEIDDVEISADASETELHAESANDADIDQLHTEQSNEAEMGHESIANEIELHAQPSNEADMAHDSELLSDEPAMQNDAGHEQSTEVDMAHVGHDSESIGDETELHTTQSNGSDVAYVGHETEIHTNSDEMRTDAGHEQSNEAEMAHVGHDSDTRHADETDAADLGRADDTGESHRDDAGIAETNALPESLDSDSDDSEGN
jgi:segregation and condensation protein B